MFHLLGKLVVRYRHILLIGWLSVLVAVSWMAPSWDSVVRDGEFAFLPEDAPSRRAEELFEKTFPDDLIASSIVIVVRRQSSQSGLLEEDKKFIEEVLKPRIEKIAQEQGGLAGEDDEEKDPASDGQEPQSQGQEVSESESIISRVRTFQDKTIGKLLQSEDNKASLVLIELTTEFLEYRNVPTINKIERLISKEGELSREEKIPPGLEMAISGPATVGRDMMQAARESSNATELWTVILVVLLLIVIYRAPVLALIPLATVFVAVNISIRLLSLLAGAELVGLFAGIEVYVTVILYGAGVDYCLFLISRYKEGLDSGASIDEAIAHSLEKVGAALAASAGTTMCGIGMMVFAEFEKFQQAGVAISMSLFVVLCAALTFTPSLLLLAGRWAFWPQMQSERVSASAGWISSTSLMARLLENNWFQAAWQRLGRLLLAKPGTIWLTSIALMVPFAVIAVLYYNYLSYGLLSELPRNEPSVIGAKAVQSHFPAGIAGPITILIENRNVDFSQSEGKQQIQKLTDRLRKQKSDIQLADIRSVSEPLGITAAQMAKQKEEGGKSSFTAGLLKSAVMRKNANDYYVSSVEEFEGHVTRLDVIFQDDPFSRNSIRQLERLEKTVQNLLPESLQGSRLLFIGPTVSIRDLKNVTDRDQIRIDILVLAGVFTILVVLLKRPSISLYLIVSVFFSYLVTLGVTFAVFWLLDPSGFAGLDWKVPMFLFTILIAVGEDYNIFLITRVDEEQSRHGMVPGTVIALTKTGSIISSCGFIMAGTFSSLMAGSLVGMKQLGFALAFGVLLDTFVVRPILVPSYLILLHSGRFGKWGKYLGARTDPPQSFANDIESETTGETSLDSVSSQSTS